MGAFGGRPEVIAYRREIMQAEDPDAEPAKSLLSRFKAVGLPTYVILRPGATAAPAALAHQAPGSGGGGVVVLDVSTSVEPRKYERIQRVLSSLSETSTRVGLGELTRPAG